MMDKTIEQLALARVRLERDRNIEELKEKLLDIEDGLKTFLSCSVQRLLNLEEFALKCKNIVAENLKLQEKHSQLLAQNVVLADALQKLTKQVYLIEQKYSIVQTIGGKN